MTKSKVASAILSEMERDPFRIHRTAKLSQVAQRATRRPTNIGPMLAYLVSKGIIHRAWWGAYHLTKPTMPSR